MSAVDADANARKARLAKALQFQVVANDALLLVDEGEDTADADMTLCLPAGIASSEALCIQNLENTLPGKTIRMPYVCLQPWTRRQPTTCPCSWA